jgi:cysteine desulfurase
MGPEGSRIAALRDRMEAGILEGSARAVRNGPVAPRLPGLSNLHFRGISGEALLLALPGVALSSGSACASASLEPSHVLLAMGRSPEVARNSLRLSLGRFNTEEEIDRVIKGLLRAVAGLEAGRESEGS